jgi:hypothetical protein
MYFQLHLPPLPSGSVAQIEAMPAHARYPGPYTGHLGPKVTHTGWIGPKSYILLNISVG